MLTDSYPRTQDVNLRIVRDEAELDNGPPVSGCNSPFLSCRGEEKALAAGVWWVRIDEFGARKGGLRGTTMTFSFLCCGGWEPQEGVAKHSHGLGGRCGRYRLR